MTRNKALKLLHEKMQNQNLRRHCYSVEAVMKVLYKRLENGKQTKEEEDMWGIVGLLHDGDYEETKGTPELHTIRMHEWLKKAGVTDEEILSAILSHNFA